MKLFRILAVIALALCVGTVAFAETQSVKISGDLTFRAIDHDQYSLANDDFDPISGANGTAAATDHNAQFLMSQIAVQVDADLTDNVAATIRLYNQRDWGLSADNGNDDVNVDLAYVQLKEFLYSPLTLTVGRQDIWLGKGFIIGANRRNTNAIGAPEYTISDSFDAIRGTLDYDPWTIDMIYAKIDGGVVQGEDDIDLYALNFGYVFEDYNAEAEAYWVYKRDASSQPNVAKGINSVHTMGLRGSGDFVDWANLFAEGAIQFGEYVHGNVASPQTSHADRLGWAFDVGTEVTYFEDNYAWQPKFGLEYIVYSGDTEGGNRVAESSKQFTGWDPMYRGKYDSKIREWIGSYYTTKQGGTIANQGLGDIDDSRTNQHQLILAGSIVPYDGVTVDGRYINFWQQKASRVNTSKRGSHLGQELDLEVSWDYTEDVSYGFLAAWYFPGDHFDEESNNVATDIVATMAVSF